ncbi:hypothetical protein L486_03751 [Kwoniella mangroviensis CBS 10435]|uniref:Uncharacterized protein n=1 Tax=Kwoniella mangroviensis CBS 10435 TaxID=1331196 RepID=A0A1B9IUN0_9TREE|nr:hypothetical protein L486_03751 [Kwoniella mangroviensis CBS 10435]
MPYAHEGDGNNDSYQNEHSSFGSHPYGGNETQYPPGPAQTYPPQGFNQVPSGYGNSTPAAGTYGSHDQSNSGFYGGQQGSYAHSQTTQSYGPSHPGAPYVNPPQQAYGQPPTWGQPTYGGSYPVASGPTSGTGFNYYQSNPQSYWNNGRPTGILAQAVQSTRPAGYTGAWPPKDAASGLIAIGALLNNKKQSSAQSGASGQFNSQGPPVYGRGGSYGPTSGYGGPSTGQGW